MVDFSEVLKQSGEQIGLTKEQINSLGKSFSDLTEKMGITINITETLGNVFEKVAESAIIDNVKGLGKALLDTSLLTEKQANTLSNLNAIIGVTSKSFTGLGAENLNTFKTQLDDVFKGIDNAKEPLKDLKKLAGALGIKTTGLESFDQLKKIVVKFAGNMAENADEALRFQNTIFKTSAAAGSLGDVINQTGDDLKNLNNVLVVQKQYLNEVYVATQEQPKVINEYYTSLAKIPKALESTVKGSKEGQKEINMLTATMQFAKGSGREFKDVVEDLNTAFVNYDLVGEDALQFTSRISQLANNYNIQLDKVRNSLINTSNSLKMFGHSGEGASKMMEGASKIMNNYIDVLKGTGISGASAVSMIEKMTKQVGDLDMASRSFISSQTGGPGGLRGAFQIEKMMREGNIDEVMEKVRKTMTQQFGRIVSVEEAAGSERAASMLAKQRMMLMKGPLGSLAGSEQEAGRLVEAFSAMEKGGGTKNLEDILQKTMSRGEELQRQTATPVSMMRADVKSIRDILQVGGLANFQQLMAASVGKNVTLTKSQQDRANAISGAMTRGVDRGAQSARVIGGSIGQINDKLFTQYIAQNINKLKQTVVDILPKTLKGFAESLGLGEMGEKLLENLNERTKVTDKMVKAKEGMTGSEREKIEKEIAKRREEESSISKAIEVANKIKEDAKKRAEAVVERRETSPDVMNKAAKSRYDYSEETAPARVAAAIPETGPAVAAAGGTPGRRGEEERSELKVKLEPETIVIEVRDKEGNKISTNEHSLAVTSVPE